MTGRPGRPEWKVERKMQVLRTIAVTFAQYSRIPVPGFVWKDEDTRYSLSVFPWIGAVIGLLFFAVWAFGRGSGLPETAILCLMSAVPVLVTGGFHVDGFLDVADARASYRSREEKLEILKDPHVGAFAVIRFALFGLLWMASLAVIVRGGAQAVLAVSGGFFLARALSALAVLSFPSAKKTGMLYGEAAAAAPARRGNRILTGIWIVACCVLELRFCAYYGASVLLAAFLALLWYHRMSSREFGGITGDLAGYFVTVSEGAMLAAAAVCCMLRQL